MMAHLKAAAVMLAPVAWLAGGLLTPEPFNWLIMFLPFMVGMGAVLLAFYLMLVDTFRA